MSQADRETTAEFLKLHAGARLDEPKPEDDPVREGGGFPQGREVVDSDRGDCLLISTGTREAVYLPTVRSGLPQVACRGKSGHRR